jgi:regulator of protease activity HflC (stomatin/prohibitin superfamily)
MQAKTSAERLWLFGIDLALQGGNMPYLLFIPFILLLFVPFTVGHCVIQEHQRGLLYRRGKFTRILEPGEHWYFRPGHTYTRVDIRIQNATIPGQEVLSADNVSLRVSLAVSYRVADPHLAVNRVVSYHEAIYLLVQLNLRDLVGALPIEELLAKRAEIGKTLFETSKEKAAQIGLELLSANIKDIMFPGDLKNIFAQVVNARHEGLAALERARGESAALRNLANAAKLLENNPELSRLRFLQLLENKGGNTVVVVSPNGIEPLREALGKEGK